MASASDSDDLLGIFEQQGQTYSTEDLKLFFQNYMPEADPSKPFNYKTAYHHTDAIKTQFLKLMQSMVLLALRLRIFLAAKPCLISILPTP